MQMPSSTTGTPWLYLRSIMVEVMQLMALILIAVVALYLSDKAITHLLFDALRYQTGILFLLETLGLAIPEILSIGFPLAVTIAVYLVLLRRREAGEFVTLSGVGLGPSALVALCFWLGVVACLVALVFRGYVEPVAAQRLSVRLVEGRTEFLQTGRLVEGQFVTVSGATYYHRPQRETATGAPVFVFYQPDTETEQIITAERVRLVLQHDGISDHLALDQPQIIGFTRGLGQNRFETLNVAVARMQLRPVPGLVPGLAPANPRPNAITLPELVTRWRAGSDRAGKETLERTLGVVLAFLAPFLAGLALAASRGRWMMVPLPAALGTVLGAGLVIEPLSGLLVTQGLMAVMIVGFLATVLASALAFGTVRLVPESLLPQRVPL